MTAPQPLRWYRVTRDGWVAGQFRREGDRLQMTARAARYEPLLAPSRAPRGRRK